MRLDSLLSVASKKLQSSGSTSPMLDARVLLAHVLQISQEKIVGYPERRIEAKDYNKFLQLVERRVKREPVAKIIGSKEFYSREFFVNEHTLDPRPDSETLIEAVLQFCSPLEGEQQSGASQDASAMRGGAVMGTKTPPHASAAAKALPQPLPLQGGAISILDLGTGTGCLLLTLLCELENGVGVGADISDEALNTAQKNAQQLKVADRVKFIKSKWMENVEGKFDIIISNPPYIKKSDIENLEPEVSKYDPILALDGGEDGLNCYREFIPQLKFLAKDGACVFLECGQGQADDVAALLEQNNFSVLEKARDLAGIERCVIASYLK